MLKLIVEIDDDDPKILGEFKEEAMRILRKEKDIDDTLVSRAHYSEVLKYLITKAVLLEKYTYIPND